MIVLGYSGYNIESHGSADIWSPFSLTGLSFDNIFDFRDGEVPFNAFPLGYFGHDASASIIVDGKVVACASEERFTRTKHGLNLAGKPLLPRNAINFCLSEAEVTIDDVDIVAHYCNFSRPILQDRLNLLRPYLSSEDSRKVEYSYENAYKSMLGREIVQEQVRNMLGFQHATFIPISHHKAHAASSYYVSGFDESLILTLDGAGEVESSLLAIGRGRMLHDMGRISLPTSLGTLYLIITVFLGFQSLGDEYKVMGLAAYGNPDRYRDFFDSMVVLDGDGSYSMPHLAKEGFKELLLKNLGQPRRRDDPIEEKHADIAAALQVALVRPVLHVLGHMRAETGIPSLCMAGGVALNCSMNGSIARSGMFEDIFIQPASSDEGCSLGAALLAYYMAETNEQQLGAGWKHAYLGPEYSTREVIDTLQRFSDQITWVREDVIEARAAEEIAAGKVVGWFQGRMEFGPRALGNRSILADPRRPEMKDIINEKVKRREQFRPFAPAVLEEEARTYFDMTGLGKSPFMLFTVPVHMDKGGMIPAVTHRDGTARVQTVSREVNPLFWSLIDKFSHQTGIPVVLNTSYNVRNEPIVCSPTDAIKCFLSTEIDSLFIDRFFVQKREPP